VLVLSPLVKRWMHLDTLDRHREPADQAAVYGGGRGRERRGRAAERG
jgi:hypothetical protein